MTSEGQWTQRDSDQDAARLKEKEVRKSNCSFCREKGKEGGKDTGWIKQSPGAAAATHLREASRRTSRSRNGSSSNSGSVLEEFGVRQSLLQYQHHPAVFGEFVLSST